MNQEPQNNTPNEGAWQPAPVAPQLDGTAVQPAGTTRAGVLSTLTLILSFFTGYIAVILGVFALRQNWVKETRGNGLAWAGIIIGAVLGTLFMGILILILKGQTSP